jgi:Spy/CpxP family protein refolding chaperone
MMSLRVGAMTQRLAGMQAMSTALTDLYAVLTPKQRTTADRLMGHRVLGGQGMHRHGMRG